MLKNVCRGDLDATDLIDEAVRNPVGTNQHMGGHNVTRLGRAPWGNSRDKALRQLRDHRPDLYGASAAGELSAHPAIIEAGFRTLAR